MDVVIIHSLVSTLAWLGVPFFLKKIRHRRLKRKHMQTQRYFICFAFLTQVLVFHFVLQYCQGKMKTRQCIQTQTASDAVAAGSSHLSRHCVPSGTGETKGEDEVHQS